MVAKGITLNENAPSMSIMMANKNKGFAISRGIKVSVKPNTAAAPKPPMASDSHFVLEIYIVRSCPPLWAVASGIAAINRMSAMGR
jgi:hypothetical protein